MERLTKRLEDGLAVMDCSSCELQEKYCTALGCRNRLKDRLAVYEDTGLAPEEVEAIKTAMTGKSIAEIKEFNGVPVAHLCDLAQAEKDGLLAVLPCKVGDIVYDIQDGTAYATRVLSFSYFEDHWACRTVSSYPDLEQFGDRIFLTRDAAEAALTKQKE